MTPTYQYEFSIGTTLAGIVNIESLASGNMPAPKAIWQPCAEYITLGDNSVAGIGLPIAIWQFGWLSRVQRDALRAYCTGPSATVFIRTQGNDSADAYGNYSAVMIWPLEEERDTTRRTNLNIIFRQLTAAS